MSVLSAMFDQPSKQVDNPSTVPTEKLLATRGDTTVVPSYANVPAGFPAASRFSFGSAGDCSSGQCGSRNNGVMRGDDGDGDDQVQPQSRSGFGGLGNGMMGPLAFMGMGMMMGGRGSGILGGLFLGMGLASLFRGGGLFGGLFNRGGGGGCNGGSCNGGDGSQMASRNYYNNQTALSSLGMPLWGLRPGFRYM